MEFGSAGDPGSELVVELDASEAAHGTVKHVAIPGPPQAAPRVIEIRIPAGVRHDTMLWLPGKGGPRPDDGAPSDLLVRVRVRSYAQAAMGTRRSSRPGKRVLVGSVALTTVLALVGLIRYGLSADPGTPDPAAAPIPAASASPSPTATTPTAAALSPAQYQRELDAVDKALAAGVRRVSTARSPAAVSSAAAGLGRSLTARTNELRASHPPALVSAEHDALVDALQTFTRNLASLASAAEAAVVCTGSSGTSSIGQSTGAGQVRAAAARLTAADRAHRYHVGTSLPPKTRSTNRRLRNGTLVKRPNGGYGQLKIENGGSVDSVISLVRLNVKKPSMTVYVRGGGSSSVRRISDGTYRIYMSTGVDWDKASRRFSRDCSFLTFTDPAKFTFTTQTTRTAIRYTVQEITVTPVAGGTATTGKVDPEAFPT